MTTRGRPRPGQKNRRNMNKIKVALVGVGNCASSLVQGRLFLCGQGVAGRADARAARRLCAVGHRVRGGVRHRRAQGRQGPRRGDLRQAQLHRSCSTARFRIPASTVRMGRVLDGMAPHMGTYGERGFIRADAPEASEDGGRRRAEGDRAPRCWSIIFPVGSEEATRFYMECALKAGVAVVNCMPVFIASDPAMGEALPRQEPADRRRRHQGAAGRDHRPPRAVQPVPRARRRR